MRICIVRMMPYPQTMGGGSTVISYLKKGLEARGHEVHVLSSKASVSDGIENNHHIGIEHKKFSPTLGGIIYRFVFEICFIISVLIWIRRLKPDVIHAQTLVSESIPLAYFGIPFIATEHGIHTEGIDSLYKKRNSVATNLLNNIYKMFEKFNARRATYVQCINSEIKEYYESLGANAILLNNPFDATPYRIEKKKEQFLCLARISEQKGQDILFNALALLDEQKVEIQVIIAGDGDKKILTQLKKQANKFKHVRVKFVGAVHGEEKVKLYAESKYYILPSRWEGQPNTILEAMASGCYIITSNVAGNRDIVKDSFGQVITINDPFILSTFMLLSMKNKKDVSLKARKEAMKYSLDKLIPQYERLYTKTKHLNISAS